MPTNVTAEYAAAELEYQKAAATEEKLKALEKMLRHAPSHKGCENLRADIKTKIAKLKGKAEKEKEQQRKKGGAAAVTIKKEGAAQVVIAGPPNTGKSALFNRLTNGKSAVGDYPFTTTKPIAGMLSYNGVLLQVVDLPPFIEGSAAKHAPLFALARSADIVLLVLDDVSALAGLRAEFEKSRIKLNQHKPPIKIKKEPAGGIIIRGEQFLQGCMPIEVREVVRLNGFMNATVEIRGPVLLQDIEDALNEGIAFLPALVVLNQKEGGQVKIRKKDGIEMFEVDILKNSLEALKQKIWENLSLIRIYTKEPGRQPSRENPLTLRRGDTIRDMARYIHKDFVKRFKFARVWGKSAKFEGQVVGLEHKLEDEDVVEMHLK